MWSDLCFKSITLDVVLRIIGGGRWNKVEAERPVVIEVRDDFGLGYNANSEGNEKWYILDTF